MECDQCQKTLIEGEKVFTAIGMTICENCNAENKGTISLDLILDKIKKMENQ